MTLTLEESTTSICLYDQGTPDRSRWVQEAGNIVLAEISKKRNEKKNEPPRQNRYHYARLKQHA